MLKKDIIVILTDYDGNCITFESLAVESWIPTPHPAQDRREHGRRRLPLDEGHQVSYLLAIRLKELTTYRVVLIYQVIVSQPFVDMTS